MPVLPPFLLEPQYRDAVWGGQRLRPGLRTAEAWVIYEGNRICGGAWDGLTLLEAAREAPEAVLGTATLARLPRGSAPRFPVLVKLLDCAGWLSLQVHPNDEQAARLAGPGHFGKTEAWHILQSDPGAEILCGFTQGADPEAIRAAVADGTLLRFARHVAMQAGETILIPAGTVHALGPGLLLYEVQQTSDLTYRVWDWDRPASAERKLHIEESLQVLDPQSAPSPLPPPAFADGREHRLVRSPYFTLSLLTLDRQPLALDPAGGSFHALTVVAGQIELRGSHASLRLESGQSAVVPALGGAYEIWAEGAARVLKAAIEAEE
jgi:mannose-6-phosphate isomerase